MKGCLYLQRHFAIIGHTIAIHLRKLGVKEFCAYTEPRTAYNYFISQEDIKYTKILLDEDIHEKYKQEKLDTQYLNWLEKEYGLPNLWPYLYIDRIIMNGQFIREYPYDKPTLTHKEMMRAAQAMAKEIISFLETEKPDFLLMSVVSSLGSMLLYHIAKKEGIKTFIIRPSRLSHDYYIASENYIRFTWAERIFNELQSGKRISPKKQEAISILEKFRNRPAPFIKDFHPSIKPISRARQLKFLLPQRFINNIRWLIKLNLTYFLKEKRDYTDEIPWYSIWDKIKRKCRKLRGYNDLYSKPDFNEKFAFYPLQLQPEISTMLMAPLYTDQINTIRHIARSLPIEFKLYVKEHFNMFGFRPRAYYKELIKIPNVKLIDPSFAGFDLIQNAKLIFVLSATTGWEAIFLKKPVISFGEIFYNALSTVKKCRGFEELPYIIKEQLENFQHNEKELINFISAILEDSVHADIYTLWEKDMSDERRAKEDAGLKMMAENIAKKIGALN